MSFQLGTADVIRDSPGIISPSFAIGQLELYDSADSSIEELTIKVIEALQRAGWKIVLRPSRDFELPDEVRSRYPHIPSAFADFLSRVEYCANPDETAWFLCARDFAGESESVWRWNEFEIMEKDWAETESKKAVVTRFWDTHLPFLLSVRTGYAFFSIDLAPERYGSVVHVLLEYGVTEPSCVSSTFEEFLEELIVTARTAEGRFSADV